MPPFRTLFAASTALVLAACAGAAPFAPAHLERVGAEESASMSPLRYASYLRRTGLEMVRTGAYSPDNGRTWQDRAPQPNFDAKLPHGYRRDVLPIFADPRNGRLVSIVAAMDTPGLDPSIVEPPEAMETYYLRYRVSVDGGRTYLFDDQVVQQGRTPEQPFDGVTRGRNGIFLGDVGSQVTLTRRGDIIVPAQACRLGPDGKLANPGGGWTWTEAVMVIGRWTRGNRIAWRISDPIAGDPARTTRGMIEPTLAELPDGHLLCVLRGGNGGSKDPGFRVPCRRWVAVSKDGGFHWTTPEPMATDDGEVLFSPSSMSLLLRHSSGRCFWIGNVSRENPRDDDPRYPLVMGEIDPRTLRLVRSTLLVVDTKRPDETDVNLSHFWGFEDRATHEVVIVGARYSAGYKSRQPVVYRIRVGAPPSPKGGTQGNRVR